MEQYLTTNELSKRIKYPPGTIRNMVCSGKFKLNVHYVKPTARKILFKWSAIELWLHGKDDSLQSGRNASQNRNPGLIHI